MFQAAYEELCTRIWIELERLVQLESRRPQDLDLRTAILRLEFVVLLDFCRSPGWHSMLSAQQRESLCSMLADALSALHVNLEQLRDGIEAAQDRVLCELLPECGTALSPDEAVQEHPAHEMRPTVAIQPAHSPRHRQESQNNRDRDHSGI